MNPAHSMLAGRPRRAAVNQTVLLAVAGVLLLFAGWMLWRHFGDNPIPNDPSTWVYFRCQGCKAEFHLDAREIDQQMQKREFGWDADGKTMLLRCTKCGQPKAAVTTRPAAAP